MNASLPYLEVVVSGDMACFTRPEMKVERVSYPVPTPSAMRGVLEAIFWKPQVRWRVREIGILEPIRWFSILRNEVNTRASDRTAARWERDGGGYDASRDRAQRHTLALRDVAYLVRADLESLPGVIDDIAKYRDQFRRRVNSGRCFAQPFLGCREFSAYFRPATPADRPIDLDENIGPMLLDLDYGADGRATPRFFDARLEQGWLRVPAA